MSVVDAQERRGRNGGAPGDEPGGSGPARPPARGWRDVPERGTVFGIKAVVLLSTALGRAPARLLVRIIAFYYTLLSRTARRAAQQFLRRMDLPAGFGAAYRQILRFAQCSLDALFFVRGKTHHFEFSRDGHEHLAELKRTGRGAVLLGAHFGSFYAMRERSDSEALQLYPLVYLKNAQRFNAALRELDPTTNARLVEMDDDDRVRFVLRVRELLDEGGLVAILADRVPKGGRSVEVDFLGDKARLPQGPCLLAASLRCPVYFTCGVYRDPDRYELHCEPFADRIVLPRGDREGAVQRYAQQYADTLARYCRLAPDNWFNFYDFWATR